MRGERQYLFHEGDLSATLDNHNQGVGQKVDSIPRDQFLATPVDDLVQHIAGQMMVTPLTIYEDRMTRDQAEIKIDVAGWPDRFTRGDGPCLIPGIRVAIAMPFTGDPVLWRLRPNTFSSVLPIGVVRGSTLEMTFEMPLDQDLQRIKKALDENLDLIRKHIGWQSQTIEQFNRNIDGTVRARVEARRQHLQKHDRLAEILAIPLARDPRAPEMKPIPVQRRIVKPLPPPPTGGFKSEWQVPEAEYENILTIIRHEGRTYEATPTTYAIHEEEELRDIILAHLNGHYKGDASGETFRRAGKTDIRIEMESRSAFVGECKIWKGPKTVTESVDQLLSYLTWRDCKAAIVIFNKDVAGFSDLLQKIRPTLESHPRFTKVTADSAQAEWRCVFRSADDDARLVHVHVFVFNIFTGGKKKQEAPTTPRTVR